MNRELHATSAVKDRAVNRRFGAAEGSVALVGSPNVGKSVLFGRLTGIYTVVSNYPGTTVEVTRGTVRVGDAQWEAVDTPGMYSLLPLSEEERVARSILVSESPTVVLHVVDCRNLDRMLPLTLQLQEGGLPVILVLNMMDEAERSGVRIDVKSLAARLGMPVVATVGTTGRGLDDLAALIERVASAGEAGSPEAQVDYGPVLEGAIAELRRLLGEGLPLSGRALALLLLQDDDEIRDMVLRGAPERWAAIGAVVTEAQAALARPVEYVAALARRARVSDLLAGTFERPAHAQGRAERRRLSDRLSALMVRPLTGVPILLLVLYLALYKFVGGFGAGTVVDFLESTVFERWLNPWMTSAVTGVVPWPPLQDLLVGDYGVLTLGLRYAVAIILPIVTLFFLVFAVIEDVGYLPRLALLLDRVFKKIGLSGRAVIPMVLGFGCATMATMVTRTLSSKRERMIATLLLSLAIPCSAQLGVIIGLLSGSPGALAIWAGVVIAVYLLIGALADRVFPGRAEPFYVEVPPLRLPKLGNILGKTFARVKWYFMEVLPLFLMASVLIWVGRLTGLFGLAIWLLRFPVEWIGMPPEAAQVFLFGFFRRDYGAAGLYDLNDAGLLDARQLVVGAVALTLFMPCIAQFLMTGKERGWKAAFGIAGFVAVVSFAVAWLLSAVWGLAGAVL